MTDLEPMTEGDLLSPEAQSFIDRHRLEKHLAIPVAQFANRHDDSRRAEDLLCMSDHMILSYGHKLGEHCRAVGFEKGADYVALRLACLFAVRSSYGMLDSAQYRALDQARHALMHLVRE